MAVPGMSENIQKRESTFFCGETNSVDQYIAKQATEVRPLLDAIRREIRKAAPDAIEKIAWQMPTYWQSENLIHFAAAKKHIGIYPGEEAIRVFADRLTGLITSKGAIRLPLDQPLDLLLVRDIVRWRVAKVSGEE